MRLDEMIKWSACVPTYCCFRVISLYIPIYRISCPNWATERYKNRPVLSVFQSSLYKIKTILFCFWRLPYIETATTCVRLLAFLIKLQMIFFAAVKVLIKTDEECYTSGSFDWLPAQMSAAITDNSSSPAQYHRKQSTRANSPQH